MSTACTGGLLVWQCSLSDAAGDDVTEHLLVRAPCLARWKPKLLCGSSVCLIFIGEEGCYVELHSIGGRGTPLPLTDQMHLMMFDAA